VQARVRRSLVPGKLLRVQQTAQCALSLSSCTLSMGCASGHQTSSTARVNSAAFCEIALMTTTSVPCWRASPSPQEHWACTSPAPIGLFSESLLIIRWAVPEQMPSSGNHSQLEVICDLATGFRANIVMRFHAKKCILHQRLFL